MKLSLGNNSVASSFNLTTTPSSSPSFELPVRHRRVRDSGSLLFMLAFLSFLAYIIWDGIYVKETDINLIVHGHDSFGNICGRNNKPIKFADRSGRNYSDKPITKYTLINSQFERYTLDTGRAKHGELVYVREQEDQAELQRLHQLELLRRHQQQQQRQPSNQVNGSAILINRAQPYAATSTNRLRFPSSSSSATGYYSTSLPSRNWPHWPASSSSGGLAGASSAPARMGQLSNMTAEPAASNDSERYDHMLVTPISVLTLPGSSSSSSSLSPSLTNPMTPFFKRGINQNEASASQLLYLTECVSSCPPGHVELVFYRCMPNNWRLSLFPNAINVTRTFIDDILTDVSHCYRELVYTFSLALVLSLALLILLRFLASLIIWSCIVLLILIFVSMAGYAWLTFYQHLMDLNALLPHDAVFSDKLASSDRWLIGSVFLTFVAFAAIATVLFMRKRILLVTRLFRESGKAIADMPMLLLQPLLTFAALLAIMAAWTMGLICLQSMKVPSVDLGTGFVVFKSETLYKLMKWYHIFAFLWVSHFAIACQHYVIGASVSKWYFSSKRHALSSPIGNSISELILYYLGSVALGSFLVVIFKVVRILTRQIQFLVQRSCLSPTPPGSGGANQSLGPSADQLISSSPSMCGSCGYVWRIFIWLFDNIVMIINRDAYVEIAIHGHSFFAGARRAFAVLASNPLRLLAIKSVGNILLVIAKICVVVGTVSVTHALLQDKAHQLNYSWSPVVIAAVYAYIVAHWFLSVYEMVIDALFICYCEDYEHAKHLETSQQQLNGSQFMTQILKSGQIY